MALRERQLAVASVLMEQAEKRAKRLSENYDQWGWLGGYEDVIDRIRQPGKELYAPMSTVNDRRYGHNWPFWRTWAEHARLRASARLLCTLSPIASGALSGLRAYVVGNGYIYRAHTEQLAPEGVVSAVQSVIDEFVREAGWCQIEQELFERSRRDGECFLLHTVAERRLSVEIIEPEQVQSPPGEDQDWTYGIETKGRKTHLPRRYNVVEDPGGLDGEEYTPEEMHHLKVNVDAKVKRGLTDFSYDTHDAIRTAGRLVDHVGQGAAIQASIALIRQHETASPSQVSDFIQAASDYDRYDPVSGRQEYSERFTPARILDIDKGTNYVAPPFATNVGGYIEVIQGVLRAVAVRWNAPEWLISADASNTNYASSVTAESPFVKRCYQEQERYKDYFLRTIRRAVQVAAQNGRIRAYGRTWGWEEIQAIVDIQVEAPTVETRNTAQDATTNRTYIEAGVKSVQTTQQELGLDSELEASNIAAWKASTGAPATGAEGQPGEAGQADPTLTLRGSVGGSQALMQIQQAYYQGQIPRDACIANARIVFGFSSEDAEALFPEIRPTKLNAKQVGQPAGPGGGDNPLASLMGGDSAGDNQSENSLENSNLGGDTGDSLGDNDAMSDLLFGDEPAPETQPDEDWPDTGLTEGERKDKLGRRMCFDDESGKRTPCAPKAGEEKERKKGAEKQTTARAGKSATSAQVATLVKDLLGKESVSKGELLGLLGHLVSMSPEEMREALKGLGLPEPSAEVLALSDAALEGVDRATELAAKHKDGSLTAEDLADLGMGDLRALGVLVGVKGRSKEELRGKILGASAKEEPAKKPAVAPSLDSDDDRITLDAEDEEPQGEQPTEDPVGPEDIVLPDEEPEKPADKEPQKEQPAAKSSPAKQPGRSAKLRQSFSKVWAGLTKFPEFRDGLVELPAIVAELEDQGFSREEIHSELERLSAEGKVELHVLNEVNQLSPAERAMAIEKNDRVYYYARIKPEYRKGGLADDKPAAKPVTAANVVDSGDFAEVWGEMNKKSNVKIPEMYDELKKRHPSLTLEQFHKILLKLKDEDRVTLQIAGHRDAEARSSEGIEGPKGLYYYIQPGAKPMTSTIAIQKATGGGDPPVKKPEPMTQPQVMEAIKDLDESVSVRPGYSHSSDSPTGKIEVTLSDSAHGHKVIREIDPASPGDLKGVIDGMHAEMNQRVETTRRKMTAEGAKLPPRQVYKRKPPAHQKTRAEAVGEGQYKSSSVRAVDPKKFGGTKQIVTLRTQDGRTYDVMPRFLVPGKNSLTKEEIEAAAPAYLERLAIRGHRAAVEKAIKDGKKVPDSVLADYPDLNSQEKR